MLSRDIGCFFVVKFADFLSVVAKPGNFVLWVLKEADDTHSFRMERAMTAEQKSRIDAYRLSGKKYVEIARLMNLPETTVKSYCYRKPLPASGPAVCPQCGKALPESRFRPRRFCSDECRNRYWYSHQEVHDRSTVVQAFCEHCGKPFMDYPQRHRKFCSHPCYIAARYGGDRHE